MHRPPPPRKRRVRITGDGSCLFRSVSLAVFGTQQLYKELRLLARIEIVENQSYYEPSNAACQPLLSRYDFVARFVHELVRDSLCWNALLLGALIALSCVLQVWIQSYYPPISCAFVSPLTVNIDGRSNSSIF